jgi:hypothetical protein
MTTLPPGEPGPDQPGPDLRPAAPAPLAPPPGPLPDAVPTDTVPTATVPTAIGPVDTRPADTRPVDTGPVDTVPADTVPAGGAGLSRLKGRHATRRHHRPDRRRADGPAPSLGPLRRRRTRSAGGPLRLALRTATGGVVVVALLLVALHIDDSTSGLDRPAPTPPAPTRPHHGARSELVAVRFRAGVDRSRARRVLHACALAATVARDDRLVAHGTLLDGRLELRPDTTATAERRLRRCLLATDTVTGVVTPVATARRRGASARDGTVTPGATPVQGTPGPSGAGSFSGAGGPFGAGGPSGVGASGAGSPFGEGGPSGPPFLSGGAGTTGEVDRHSPHRSGDGRMRTPPGAGPATTETA